MLLGALGHLAVVGCTPFEMWKAVGEIVGAASVGINEDNVVLVQDYMMTAYQLKPPTLGASQPKALVLNFEHSRLARPLAELQ